MGPFFIVHPFKKKKKVFQPIDGNLDPMNYKITNMSYAVLCTESALKLSLASKACIFSCVRPFYD